MWDRPPFARWTYQADVLWESGTSGALLLMASAFAIVSVFVLAYPVLRYRARLAPLPLALTAFPVAAMLASFSWLVTLARQDWLPFALQKPNARVTRNFVDPLGLVHLATHLVAITILVIVAMSVTIALRARASRTTRALALASAAIVGVTAWIAMKQSVVYDWSGCGNPEGVNLYLREQVADAQQLLANWKHWLLALSLLCLGACLTVGLREARRGRRVSYCQALGAAALLWTGVLAFAATRGAAADARVHIPHVPLNNRCAIEAGPLPQQVVNCTELPESPVVEWASAERIFWHSGGASNPGSIVSRKDLREHVQVNARLWRQINPGHKFPGSIGLAAASDVPVASIALALLQAAGYERVFLMMRSVPAPLETKTIRVVSLWSRCCALEIRLDPGGVPVEEFVTYGDLVHAQQEAMRRGTLLTVAP